MASKPPPVPSKNALRALRHLAFSTPTVFLTAAGGACAIATLNYEAHRKVKLAERIIETKRTIRSVANAQGSAHVRRMFEAAERGEDFTLDPKNANRRRRVRNYSALAHAEIGDEETEIARLQNVLNESRQQQPQKSSDSKKKREGHLNISSSTRGWRLTDPAKHYAHRYRSGSAGQDVPTSTTTPDVPKVRHIQSSQRQHLRSDTVLPTVSSDPDLTKGDLRFKNTKVESIRVASQMQFKDPDYTIHARPRSCPEDSAVVSSETTFPDNNAANAVNEGDFIATSDEPPGLSLTDESLKAKADAKIEPEFASRDIDSASKITSSASLASRQHDEDLESSKHPLVAKVRKCQVSIPIIRKSLSQSPPQVWSGQLCVAEHVVNADPHNASLQILDNTRETEAPFHNSLTLDAQDTEAPALDNWEDQVNYFRKHHESFLKTSKSLSQAQRVQDLHLQSGRNVEDSNATIVYQQPKPVSQMIEESLDEAEANTSGIAPGRTKAQTHGLEAEKTASHIMQQIRKSDPSVQFEEWLDQVSIHSDRSGPDERRVVEILTLNFPEIAGQGRWSKRGVEHVHHYLGHASQRHKADQILFPKVHELRNRLQRPQDYLSAFCYHYQDATKQFNETERVIQAARRHRVQLAEKLFVPVLLSVCSMGRVQEAETFVIDMSDKYGIMPGYETRYLLANALASLGDLQGLDLYLSRWHQPAYSRKRVFAFGKLFRAMFEHHLAQRSINESFDYLVHALRYWGLVPTADITAILIPACVLHSRFELIESWVQVTRELYPQIDVGTTSPDTVCRVADVWFQQRMSCEEIERTCHAMACAAVSDPFSDSLREIAMQAMKEDLQRRLISSPTCMDFCERRNLSPQTMSFQTLLTVSLMLIRSNENARSSLIRRFFLTLGRQIDAVARIGDLFGGQPAQARFQSITIERSARQAGRQITARLDDATDSGNFLPHRAKLWQLMARHYRTDQLNGTMPKHDLLDAVVRRLGMQKRQDEAHDLLRSIYESPYVHGTHGTAFGESTLSAWLMTALELKSQASVEFVLFACLECARNFKLSTRFRVLFEMTAERLVRPDFDYQVMNTKEAKEEIKYLTQRLIRSQKRQEGDFEWMKRERFSTWKPWWERMPLTQSGFGQKYVSPEYLQQVAVA